jgi:hypothetical protein
MGWLRCKRYEHELPKMMADVHALCLGIILGKLNCGHNTFVGLVCKVKVGHDAIVGVCGRVSLYVVHLC